MSIVDMTNSEMLNSHRGNPFMHNSCLISDHFLLMFVMNSRGAKQNLDLQSDTRVDTKLTPNGLPRCKHLHKSLEGLPIRQGGLQSNMSM